MDCPCGYVFKRFQASKQPSLDNQSMSSCVSKSRNTACITLRTCEGAAVGVIISLRVVISASRASSAATFSATSLREMITPTAAPSQVSSGDACCM